MVFSAVPFKGGTPLELASPLKSTQQAEEGCCRPARLLTWLWPKNCRENLGSELQPGPFMTWKSLGNLAG